MNRKNGFLFFLALLLLSGSAVAQNTSNRGTDFWVGYMAHEDGTNSSMSLFITSDVSTTGTVSMPLLGWSTSFVVTANKTTVVPIPTDSAYVDCSDCIENKGIHVTSLLPIVVYSEIYFSERSEATLVLPVPTLGKEYYALAFTQTAGGYSEFLIVADEDSTEVQITPTQSTLNGHSATVPFTVTLNRGQVYQVQSLTDLTGSHIVTYSSGTSSCKRIAVFSGSTWCGLGCPGNGTKDNLLEQLYPVNAWGSNFVTAPFLTRTGGDIFRIFSANDNTSVAINGGIPFTLNKTQFTDMLLDSANYITSTKPILLAEYSRTESCDGASAGDPSMVIILPLDQTLDSITLYSTPEADMTGEYINVIMKTANISSFRLDGNPVSFHAVPYNPIYSYSQNTVDSGNHVLIADSGFNAIAYGFGNVDGYSYSAGANVRNLGQFITVNSGGVGNPRTLCSGALVNFSGALAYTPLSVKWYFGDGDTSSTLNTTHTYTIRGTYTISLVTVRGDSSCDTKDSSTYLLTITSFNVGTITALHDSICKGTLAKLTVKGSSGNIQWQQSATSTFFTNISGVTNTTYTPLLSQTTYFRIYVKNGICVDTSDVFTITVISPPVANYSATSLGQTTTFNSDSTIGATSFVWDFGDGETSTEANPSHIYDTVGTYHVCLTVQNNTNCNFTFCRNVTVFPDGVKDLNNPIDIQVYPNPFGNSIFIDGGELSKGISNVVVFDILGQVAFSRDYLSQKTVELPLSNLPEGMYYLEVKTGNNNYFRPIIKQYIQQK